MNPIKPIVFYTDELIRYAERGMPHIALEAFQRGVQSFRAVKFELNEPHFSFLLPRLLPSADVPWVSAYIPDVSLVIPDMGIYGDCPLVISRDAVSPWLRTNQIRVLELYAKAVLNPQAFFEQPRARIKVSASQRQPERHYLVGPRDLLGADPK